MADEDPGPHFRVSDRVLCIDASAPRLVQDFRPLVRGKIYSVRGIDTGRAGSVRRTSACIWRDCGSGIRAAAYGP
jgi:hypothetical protein